MDPSLVRGAHAGGTSRYDGQEEPPASLSPSSPFDTRSAQKAGGENERSRLLDRALNRGQHHHHPEKGMHLETMAAMVFVPWLMFFVVALTIALAPASRASRGFAWTLQILCLGFSVLLLQVYLHSRAPIYKYVGGLGLVAVLLASVEGSVAYDRYTLPYWMSASRARVQNVTPSLPGTGYSNAASLTFTADTGIDLDRTLGYRGRETDGTVYCVAPVLDTAGAEVDEVRFWAIGTDCCMPTWGFQCGAAESPTARSGVVFRNVPGSRTSKKTHQIFANAAKQAAALYHLRTSDEPIFVHWTQDADADLGNLFSMAVLSVCISSIIYLVASMVIAGWLHWLSGRPPKDWQRLPRGLGYQGMA